MTKKITGLEIALIMLFSFAACDFDTRLTEYKATAKTELEIYAEIKGQDNYTVANWKIVGELVIQGKMAIDMAIDNGGVDFVVEETKHEIDKLPLKESLSFLEMDNDEMIILSQVPTSVDIAFIEIKFEYEDVNAVFECTIDRGIFYQPEMGYITENNVNIAGGESICWRPMEMEVDGKVDRKQIEQAFVEIVIKAENNFIGYAVIEFLQTQAPSVYWYGKTVLKTAVFPKVNDIYQNVTEEYIKVAIDKAKL